MSIRWRRSFPPPLALIHNHFLDKLIEHGRCKLGEIRVAFHKLDKLVCFQLVGVPVFNLPLPFRYGRFQPGLFLVILGKKPGNQLTRWITASMAASIFTVGIWCMVQSWIKWR